MISAPFAVPVAVSADGRLVQPAEGTRGERFRCPGCGTEVILRKGRVKRPHFAHRGGDACSPESALHRAAKGLLRQVVTDWKRGVGPSPCVTRPCPSYPCAGAIVQDIPADVTHALEEVRVSDGSVADVVLFRGDVPAVAIEVLATHRVTSVKAQRLRLPWMEVRAADLLDRPFWWVALQDGMRPFTCPACGGRDEG